MKNALMNFRENFLSKDEMKNVVGSNGTWCRAVCVYSGGGGSYETGGWCGGSVADCVGRRLPGTSASVGLVCVNMECNYK